MRISELADHVGVAASTVRYYERVGLLEEPPRTSSGYRDYGEDDAARLLFISRARKLGLSCDQIAGARSDLGRHELRGRTRAGRAADPDKQAEIAVALPNSRALRRSSTPWAPRSRPPFRQQPVGRISPVAFQKRVRNLFPSNSFACPSRCRLSPDGVAVYRRPWRR